MHIARLSCFLMTDKTTGDISDKYVIKRAICGIMGKTVTNWIKRGRNNMANMTVNKGKCIGCRLCVRDCLRNTIFIREGKAEIDVSGCIKCGHCIAVCPQDAVSLGSIENMQWDSGGSGPKRGSAPDPEVFLNFLKFRRSIRQYKKHEIEPEKMEAIIEAGRYSPTAGNRQKNRFIILKENIEQVRKAAIETLRHAAADESKDLGEREIYRKSWARMYDDYAEGRRDGLFFNAPAVILIVSDENNHYAEIDGGIAASRMELQANALGLGVCYIGFLNTAMEFDGRIKEMAGLKEDEKLAVAFVTGYADVEYQRPAPRKPANVRKL